MLYSSLPEHFFQSVDSMKFHPAGSFLLVCGVLAEGDPRGSVDSTAASLSTLAVKPGELAPVGTLPVDGCGPMDLTSPSP